MTQCPNCGAPLEDGDDFCGACGTPIGEGHGATPEDDRAAEYTDQPGGPGREGQSRGQDRRGDQHYRGQPDHQPHGGRPADRPHEGRPGDQRRRGEQPPRQQQGRPGDQQGAPDQNGPESWIGGGAQPGQPRQGQSRQGQPRQGQPRQGQPRQGQPGQPPGQPRRAPHGYQTGGSDRRDVLKYGVGAAVVLGGGWLLYDNLLGSDLSPEEQAAKDVVERNLRAYENEDLEGVKATTHPESPKYDNTIQGAQLMFSEYDLTYDLEIKSVEVDGDEARVEVVQTTRKESGPQFQDNRIEATHVLRKYDGEWRIYDTDVEDIEYLD